jgi:Fe-S-cluster containining protein
VLAAGEGEVIDDKVPCNGCTLCCQRDLIPLIPELGDDPANYQTVVIDDHVVLARAENGDCVYLDRKLGCTIYDRRPGICRGFDCAAAFKSTPPARRALLIEQGKASPAVFERGRQLLRNGYRPAALARRRHILGRIARGER